VTARAPERWVARRSRGTLRALMSRPASPQHPVKVVVGAEACERFAFHALAAVLVLYLNEHLLYAERDARTAFHLFLAAVYLAPLAGRALAARLGTLSTLRWGQAAYLAGLAVLAAFESRSGVLAGLVLVAAGAGVAKRAASALVGEALGGAGRERAGASHGALYAAVNGASLAAKVAAPLLLAAFGPRSPLALAAAALAASVVVLRAGSSRLAPAPVPPRDRHGFLRVVSTALARLGTGRPGQHWLDGARAAHSAEAVEGVRAVLRLAPVFAALAVFWALFDQRGAAFVFQARRLDLAVAGHLLSPAHLQALNPLLVLVLVPLLGRVVFPALARRGVPLRPLGNVSVGLFASAAAFAAAGALQAAIDAGHTPHAVWQLPQYLLLTLGEVLVSVTGLELAYAHAPRAMRQTVMSLGFLTVVAGNLVAAAAGELFRLDGARWYWAFAALMLATAIAFRALARRWRGTSAEPLPRRVAGGGG
jgi:proton-dependent oligopeptide transporter, POT family